MGFDRERVKEKKTSDILIHLAVVVFWKGDDVIALAPPSTVLDFKRDEKIRNHSVSLLQKYIYWTKMHKM